MESINKGHYNLPKGARIVRLMIIGLIAAIFFGFVFGFFVKSLWNWLMPELFSISEITYWQAFGIVLLARLLFGSFGGSYTGMSKSTRSQKRQWHGKDVGEDYPKTRPWRYYDEWWENEGERVFEEYVERMSGEKP